MLRRRSIWHFILLFLITVLGAALRFYRLDRPLIWGDEGLTWARVCGSFEDLLHRLSGSGFGPVHYESLWALGQHFGLGPWVLRLIPAVCGTLMVPAMYWLSRELLGHDRRHEPVTLLVALITATNAFLLDFSRDAKMYSAFWFFAAVNVASFLSWLRFRRAPMYMLWIASGAAMLGFDLLGLITLTIELVIVLTARRPHWLSIPKTLASLLLALGIWLITVGPLLALFILLTRDVPPPWRRWLVVVIVLGFLNLVRLGLLLFVRVGDMAISERRVIRPIAPWLNRNFAFPPLLLFILGVLLIVLGPSGYYLEFNHFFDRVDDFGWSQSGLGWLKSYNAGRTGPTLLGYAASAYLTGWEWPRDVDVASVPIRTYRLLAGSTIVLCILLTLGLLPWPRKHTAATLPLDEPRRTAGPFRVAFWMAIWMVLPPYGFYLVSEPDHASPLSWITAAISLFNSHIWLWIILAVLAGVWTWMSAHVWRMRATNIVQALAVIFVALAIGELLFRGYPSLDQMLSAKSEGWRKHETVWNPRYIAVILPPVIIFMSVLLWRLPTRPLRWGAIALLVIVNLAQHGARVLADNEPPVDVMAQDLLDSQAGQAVDPIKHVTAATRTYYTVPIQQTGGYVPGAAGMWSTSFYYYLSIESGKLILPVKGNNPWARLMSMGAGPGGDFGGRKPENLIVYPTQRWQNFDDAVVFDVRRQTNLKRFVIWQLLQPNEVDLTDRPLERLSPQWRLESQTDYRSRDHWRWLDMPTFRRRVYVRIDSD